MNRFTHDASGVTVSVSDETATLLGAGWTQVEDDEAPKKPRARKTAE